MARGEAPEEGAPGWLGCLPFIWLGAGAVLILSEQMYIAGAVTFGPMGFLAGYFWHKENG